MTKLQDAGAPEPLAVATVEVVEDAAETSTQHLVTEERLGAVLYRALLIQTGVVTAIVFGINALFRFI